MKRIILRTVDSTLASKDASLVMITLQRHLALMCQLTVELDFFANGRFILSYRLGNSGFSGIVCYAGKDDASFFKG